MKLKSLLEQLNQLAKERPEVLEKNVYYSDKFDIIQDRKNRDWDCDLEDRLKKASWFRKKLRFIKKIRHLDALAYNGFWESQSALQVQSYYRNKLKELSQHESELQKREIAVLALEKANNKQ